MTAIPSVSPDMTFSRVAAVPAAAPMVAVPALAPTNPDKSPFDQRVPAGTAAANDRSAPLQPRTVTITDVTTGLLIQTDRDPQTGETVSQFPDRALLESYAEQLRLLDGDSVTHSLNT